VAAITYEQCVCELPIASARAESAELTPAMMDGIARAVESKLDRPGLAIVPGDGLRELSDPALSAWFQALTRLLGVPVAQNRAGETLVEIADQRSEGGKPVRGYQTNESMLLHTDASDVAALLCLSPAERGGTSLFAGARQLHDAIAAARPDLMKQYFSAWRWNLVNLGLTGSNAELTSPIFSFHSDELSCRYGSHFLRSAASEARPLTHLQVEALDAFEGASRHEDILLRYKMRRGDSVWMNNCKVLHGREAFEDEGATRRRYLRCWIRRKRQPNVVAGFGDFDAAILASFGDIGHH
jgi:hypothetical protein